MVSCGGSQDVSDQLIVACVVVPPRIQRLVGRGGPYADPGPGRRACRFLALGVPDSAESVPAHGAGVLRRSGPPSGATGRPAARGDPEPPGRRGLRPGRSGEDPAVLRPLAREDAAESAHHRRRRAGPVQDREGHLREPPGLPGHGESLRPQGPDVSAARRGRHLRPLGQRQGRPSLPVVRPGPGPAWATWS